ncbi:MAG TPA: polyphosphate:AMP phosphotransferase [Spirochaetia bacterium]|nr:polyphosphate:AMP phosphotransferase [Spirochaetia bacterium]
MLESMDLKRSLKKSDFNTLVETMSIRLGELQREVRARKTPVIIVFDGWEAAGKGTVMNNLIGCFDSRGFRVHALSAATPDEELRPYLWRFWQKLPAAGRIAVFERGWYEQVSAGTADRKRREELYEDATSFERQLTDDGCLIIKFFLHITAHEQSRRFEKLASNDATSWRVTKGDRKQNTHYDRFLRHYDEMIARTDTEFAPWTLVEAMDERYATIKVFETVIARFEETEDAGTVDAPASVHDSSIESSSVLDGVDLSKSIDREIYQRRLLRAQKRLRLLEHEIYERRIPVVICYEGWDAAGKGGNIRRLTQALDPRGYEVIPVAAPTAEERDHHYLWRFWTRFPKAGHIAIFDRTWYGRVLVERVEGFCAESEWRRAFREINEMESEFERFGAVLVKFWLEIDSEEQLRRFTERQNTPAKQWKITDEDWRNREKRDAYRVAVDEMLLRTSTRGAPWTIVESNCKWHARVKSLETVIAAIERTLAHK